MDNKSVEEAKERLKLDLQDLPNVFKDPIGDARTLHKLLDYIFVCILAGEPKSDCVDWLYNLCKDQNDNEREKFSSNIDLVANALYRFYDNLKKLNQIK